MKKSAIKYLVILVVIIIIISFTGYNLETEPKTNISVIDQKQLKNYISGQGTYKLKYVNLTYDNSKAEYLVECWYIPQIYTTSFEYNVGYINIYKLSQTINFPLTSTAIEIKDIKMYVNNYCGLNNNPKPYKLNNTVSWSLATYFVVSGNNSIHVSFDIVPVYNIWIYHFNGKAIHFDYNYTLESKSCT